MVALPVRCLFPAAATRVVSLSSLAFHAAPATTTPKTCSEVGMPEVRGGNGAFYYYYYYLAAPFPTLQLPPNPRVRGVGGTLRPLLPTWMTLPPLSPSLFLLLPPSASPTSTPPHPHPIPTPTAPFMVKLYFPPIPTPQPLHCFIPSTVPPTLHDVLAGLAACSLICDGGATQRTQHTPAHESALQYTPVIESASRHTSASSWLTHCIDHSTSYHLGNHIYITHAAYTHMGTNASKTSVINATISSTCSQL